MSSSSISCKLNIDGEGKQKIQGYHFINFYFGGAKWIPTFKKKGGPYTALTTNRKLTVKKSHNKSHINVEC